MKGEAEDDFCRPTRDAHRVKYFLFGTTCSSASGIKEESKEARRQQGINPLVS